MQGSLHEHNAQVDNVMATGTKVKEHETKYILWKKNY